MIIDKRKRVLSPSEPAGKEVPQEEKKDKKDPGMTVQTDRTEDHAVRHLQMLNAAGQLPWIKLYTCFVSAMALILDKEYVIDSTVILDDRGYQSSNFRDNFDTDPKALKKKIKWLRKDREYEKAKELETLPEGLVIRSRQNAEHMEEIRSAVRECGFELEETVTRMTENTGPYRNNIDESFDQHRFRIPETIITPDSFRTTFRDVYEKYTQIREREEIRTIASQLSRSVIRSNRLHVKNLQFLFKMKTYEFEFLAASSYNTAEHELVGGDRIRFSSLGMAPLPDWKEDFATFSAAGISVLERIINDSKKDGKIVLDIGSVSAASVNESVPDDWSLGIFSFPLRYLLDNYDEYFTTLKQW